MSRAFGNRLLKRFVVADPEIQVSFNSHKLCILSIERGINTTLTPEMSDAICGLDHK